VTSCRFNVTLFENFAATTKTEQVFTLESVADRIRNTSRARKEWLPWLKLARFGDRRTDKNSLRHDANVLAISGVEGDYDAERMSFDDAVDLLEQQGIAAIVYTSRWGDSTDCSGASLRVKAGR
jgi:hypothetical protein